MEHLTTERLARVVDAEPTAEEGAHLRSCQECRHELQALRDQTEALGALPDLMPPRGDWEELEARLTSEGLIRSGHRFGQFTVTASWIQIAAALVLFISGTAMGAAFSGRPGPVVDALDPGATPAPVVRTASTAQEAAEILQSVEQQYLGALMQYRRLAGFESGDAGGTDAVDRFAALEAVLSASRAALRQAPADPFLNGILMSTMAERQAALQQISTSDDDNWF